MLKSIPALALAALLALAGPARAAVIVPKGKAAVVEAVLGKVTLVAAGKESKPKVGQALAFGDRLTTGANGRVSLRHAGNAISRLAPNSELSLLAPGAKKGTFMKLGSGLVRFLVGKRKAGETFEIETSNAVAAVKGTDGQVETDGKSTKSAVFESARQRALQFIETKTGKSVDLSPGQGSELDENGFDTHELTQEEREQSDQQFEGLPEAQVEEGNGEQGQGGDGQQGQQAQGGEDQGGGDEIVEDIQDAFTEVMDDLGLDSFLEKDERTGDLVAGRIVYDRNGDRAQVSAYITRPDEKTVFKANYTRRDSGPFQGTSRAEELTSWNRPLEGNWQDIAARALDDPANVDANGDPIYWRNYQYFEAANPQGDWLGVETVYDQLLRLGVWNGNGYDPGAVSPDQGFTRDLYGNGTLLFTYQNYVPTTTDANWPGVTMAQYGYINSSWNSTSSATSDGGVRIDMDTYNGVFFSAEFRVLDNDGNLYDISSLGGQPITFRDLKGLDNGLNLEVTFECPGFSAPIDLIFIPEVFDSMDILDLPSAYYGGA